MTHESSFTHLRGDGCAYMVDVTEKTPSVRTASAQAVVAVHPDVVATIKAHDLPKGDIFAVARIAAIQAVKRTPELLPLAHVIGIHGCSVDVTLCSEGIQIAATVRTADRTGVEMEALTAVTVGALAVVDMVKGIDRSARIVEAKIMTKSGGRSGNWVRFE